MKKNKNTVADELFKQRSKLRGDLLKVDDKLRALQNKCKHQFVAYGMDSKYYYAKCTCHKNIRFEHNLLKDDFDIEKAETHFRTKVKNSVVLPKEYEPYA